MAFGLVSKSGTTMSYQACRSGCSRSLRDTKCFSRPIWLQMLLHLSLFGAYSCRWRYSGIGATRSFRATRILPRRSRLFVRSASINASGVSPLSLFRWGKHMGFPFFRNRPYALASADLLLLDANQLMCGFASSWWFWTIHDVRCFTWNFRSVASRMVAPTPSSSVSSSSSASESRSKLNKVNILPENDEG
jgi:hypothetical protein